jgi:hypothetical protein
MYFGDSCPCPNNAQFLASKVKSETATTAPSLDADEEFARRLQAELNGEVDPTPTASSLPNPGIYQPKLLV